MSDQSPSDPAPLCQLGQWVIDNIYTIARRESRREQSKLRPEMWGHVLRLCEKAGAHTRTVGVLRELDAALSASAVSGEPSSQLGEGNYDPTDD
jgi:hypothetical protein